jgi:hypothetical protein
MLNKTGYFYLELGNPEEKHENRTGDTHSEPLNFNIRRSLS